MTFNTPFYDGPPSNIQIYISDVDSVVSNKITNFSVSYCVIICDNLKIAGKFYFDSDIMAFNLRDDDKKTLEDIEVGLSHKVFAEIHCKIDVEVSTFIREAKLLYLKNNIKKYNYFYLCNSAHFQNIELVVVSRVELNRPDTREIDKDQAYCIFQENEDTLFMDEYGNFIADEVFEDREDY